MNKAYAQIKVSGAVVSVYGEIDLSNCAEFEAAAGTAKPAAFGGWLTMDLRGVEFMDSAALKVLVDLHRGHKSGAYTLRIFVSPGSRPERVMTLGGFGTVFSVLPLPLGDALPQ